MHNIFLYDRVLATIILMITLNSCSDTVALSERNNSKSKPFEVQISHNPIVGSKFCIDSIDVEFKIPRTHSNYELNLYYDNKIINTKIIDKEFFRNQSKDDFSYLNSKWIDFKIPAWNQLKVDSVAVELELKKNEEILYSNSSKIIYLENNQSISIARRKLEIIYAKRLRFNSGLIPKSKLGLYTTNLKGNLKIERFQGNFKVTDTFEGSKLYLVDKDSSNKNIFAKTLNIPNFELTVSSEFNLRLENRDRTYFGSTEVTRNNENNYFGYVYNKRFIGEQQTLKFNECQRLVSERDSIYIPFTYRITTIDEKSQ
jgi:hypothetical protein